MDETQKALRERYPHIHPLVFHRCLEKAKTNGELFDMLDGMPDPPVYWHEESRSWVHEEDVLQKHLLENILKKSPQPKEEKDV